MSVSLSRNGLGFCTLTAAVLLAACGRTPMLPAPGQENGDESGENEPMPNRHPWPLYGRDPQGTRSSPVDTSGNKGKLKWRFKTDSQVHSSPILGEDGTVYVFTTDFTLYALAPPTTGTEGVLKWRFEGARIPDSNGYWARSPALAADGTVYVASDKLYAVSPPATGKEGVLKWSYQVPRTKMESHEWPTIGGPSIGADGTIYVAGAQLCALSPVPKGSNGVLRWSFDEVSGQETPPAIAPDGTIYVDGAGGLAGISPPTRGTRGSLMWSFPAEYIGWSSAVADDGTVYGRELNGDGVVAVSPPAAGQEGKVVWSYATRCGFIDGPPAIGPDGALYVGCTDGDLLALAKPRTGNLGELRWRWFHHGAHGVRSAPAVGADGTVFFGANDGNIYAVSPPETGTVAVEKWAFRTQGPVFSSPAIGPDGTVYAGSVDQYVYAIQ